VAFASAPVTVATTATALHASDADGQSLLVSNVGAATVYLGPAGVTTSTGVRVVVRERPGRAGHERTSRV